MAGRPVSDAWQTVIDYANTDHAKVFTVKQETTNTINYKPETDEIVLISQHHAANGVPFHLSRSAFERVWKELRDGATLSRSETKYTDTPKLLGDNKRASGVMELLDTIFDEVDSATDPVRIWLTD